jgi:hypothetical protein
VQTVYCRLRWVLVGVLTAGLAAVIFALQPRPFYHDPSVFIVIGRGLFSGQVPFLDLWDHKPPGTYLVGSAAWALYQSDTTASMQGLSAIAIGVTGAACGWLVTSVYSRFESGVATAVVLALGLCLPTVSSGGGMTELFSVMGLALAFAAVSGMALGRRGMAWPIVAGASFSWAVNCSLLAMAAVPALAVLWLSIPIGAGSFPPSRSNWRTWVLRRLVDLRLLVAVVAAVAVTAVVWWPVLVGGGLPAAIEALWRYNGLYSAGGGYHLGGWKSAIELIWPIWLPTLVLGLIPAARRRLLGFQLLRSLFTWAMVLWLAVEFVMVFTGRRFYAHNLTLFIAPLAVLMGFAISQLWLDQAVVVRRALIAAASLAIAIGLGWPLSQAAPTSKEIAASNQIAAYVDANSAPGDTIYVWGDDPDLYLRADRAPAGRFFQLNPLIMPGYEQQAVADTLNTWLAHPPRLIIMSLGTTTDALTMYPLIQTPSQGTASSRPALRPLQDFIRAHYDLAATYAVGEIWRYHQ